MIETVSSLITANRRKTSRDPILITGTIKIIKGSITNSTETELADISYDGIQCVFSDDDFLFKYLELFDEKKGKIIVEFSYEEKIYVLECDIKWLRLYNLGEKNFYVLTALSFLNIDKIEDDLLNIITILKMKNFYAK